MRIDRCLIGRCPGCNSIVAAALIANTEESRLTAWNEMLKAESGLAISEVAVPGDVDGPVIQLCRCRELIDHLRAEKRAMQARIDAASRVNRKIAEELAGKSAEIAVLRSALTGKVHEAHVDDACMSFRHDFGLLEPQEQRSIRGRAMEWLIAWGKALLEPSAAAKSALSNDGKQETCVWTWNCSGFWHIGCEVRSWVLHDTPEMCPFCGKRIMVDGKHSLMQVVAAKDAEIKKLRNALVESMITPEALLIAGKPDCIAQEVWDQIVRSVEIARAALGIA